MDKNSRIYVAGHTGLVGSAVVKELKRQEYNNILTVPSTLLDLRKTESVQYHFKNILRQPIDYMFICAAKVGGIHANNTYPAEFIYDNLMIQTNLISIAHETLMKKVLFLGSSCIYPKYSAQPIREDSLMTGILEETNSAYALAKLAGIEMCKAYNKQYASTHFICAMPTNLYGRYDNFDPYNSHVIPGLIQKFHNAKINNLPNVKIWGQPYVRREFLHVDDLAKALVFLMNKYDFTEIINVGYGSDIKIETLAEKIKRIVGYTGKIEYDSTMPSGVYQKLLDSNRIFDMGWKPEITLEYGLTDTYNWYKKENTNENS